VKSAVKQKGCFLKDKSWTWTNFLLFYFNQLGLFGTKAQLTVTFCLTFPTNWLGFLPKWLG
jgi:hypothetical protein